MRRRLIGGAALCAALVVPALAPRAPGLPRAEADPEVHRLLAPGIELHGFTRHDPAAGPQEVRVIRFRLDDPRIHLRPVAAADYGARRLKVSDLVLRSGAVAAVNGNFFTADGNSRGLLVTNGILRSEPEAAVSGSLTPRAAWRVEDRSIAFGRPGSVLRWSRRTEEFGINGIERHPGYLGNPDESVLVTPRFGPVSPTPAEGVDVALAGVPPLRANVPVTATVSTVRTGPGEVPAGGAVVSATGRNAQQIVGAGVAPGDVVALRVDIDDPAFAGAEWAGGGGPWIVHEGAPVDRAGMLGEGFAPGHIDGRAPRTAMGRAADGTVLLVTVDGRQPGRSHGASLHSLARILIEQGATAAISLDGGGSTAMAVDTGLVNVPSGEDTTGRRGSEAWVADAVGVFFDFSPVSTRRLAGEDRIATAVQVSRERPSAGTVVLATSTGFADALVGGPLAAHLGGPVLLTGPDALDGRVAAEIARLGATTAVVLGGPVALSPQVEADLQAAGVTSIRRIAGADRFETAAHVATAQPPSDTVVVASGEAFPDALAGGALGLPVLLTTRDALPEATRTALREVRPVLVGGPAAVGAGAPPGAERIAGVDRFDTSARVVDWGLAAGRYEASRVLLARGDAFPDALVGGALRRPLLLVGRTSLDEAPATRDWLQAHGDPVGSAVLLGGRAALSLLSHMQAEDAVAPGARFATVPGDLAVR